MSTTDQLPEPELGYIKTDKSNQPAFSARQMREAMKHAMQTSAEVQGELSVDQMREMLSVHKLAIVPMRATHAMLDAMSDDDWQWSDLLAAAEAVTEDEHDWIGATPQPAQATQESA